LNRLGEITPNTWCVLELSSFQLANMHLSPQVGAVLNITPNHLDRHPDMDDYIRSKANIVAHQGPDDTAVLNADDEISLGLAHSSRTVTFSLRHPVEEGAWLEGDVLRLSSVDEPLMTQSEIPLRGIHNVANALAAAAIARTVTTEPAAISAAIRKFRPVPHRLETVAIIHGVDYVNDSIGTSPERSCAALLAIDTPIVLIAGGRDKHLPMENWARLIVERARAVVLVGEAAPLIHDAIAAVSAEVPVARASSFAETIPLARSFAQPGDTVLLSPGCTSFDEFRDYEARGEAFRRAVKRLAGGDEA
jgi:UDP-N-acetylmuramoylalanine--D-glutamate ligase